MAFSFRVALERCLLVVDLFGAMLHAATRDELEATQSSTASASVSLSGASFVAEDRASPIGLPFETVSLSRAIKIRSLLTSPYSHRIRLFPLCLP